MLARKSLLTLFSNFVYYILYGITLLLAVNKFLPENFGYSKVATSLMGFFLFFSDLSFSVLHSKLMAEDKEPQNDYFTAYFFIKIILSSIMTIFIFIIIFYQINLGIISNNIVQIGILIILYFTSLIQSFNLLYSSSFAAKLQIVQREIAFTFSRIIGSIYLLFIIFFSNSFLLYISGNLVSEFLFLIINIIFGKNFRIRKIRRDLIYQYFHLGMILIIPSLFLTFSTYLGPLIFKIYYNDDKILGVYDVITSFFLMITLIEGTLRILLIPNYSSLITQKKFNQIRNSIFYFEKYVTVFNSLIVIGGLILGPFLLQRFLGQYYYENGLIIFIGNLLFLLHFGVLVPYSSLIFASLKMEIYVVVIVFNFIFALICWFIFIPIIGIVAIDLAKWIYWIPNTILFRCYCNKYFKIGKIEKKVIINFLIIILFIISSIYISRFILDKLILTFISTVGILTLYILILIGFKILTKQDYEFFKEVLNPKKMVKFIKTEIRNDGENI